MVLTVHLFQYITPPHGNILLHITRYGDRGVPIFFSLSGFLIMASIEKKHNIIHFYLKRFFRIIPLYYTIVTILAIFYTMPVDELGLGWLRYYLFMNEIIPAQHSEWISICGFWCMPSFIIFYIIAPAIAKYSNSFKIMGILTIATYLAGKGLTYLLADYIHPVRSFINTMPIFFYGCFCYSAHKENKQNLFLFISICILIISATLNLSNYQVWGVATAAAISVTHNIKLPNKISNNRFLLYFSKLSFTIFLSHYMVLLYLKSLNIDSIVFIILFILITGSVAFLLYTTIEKWSNFILKRILSSQKLFNRHDYHKNQ